MIRLERARTRKAIPAAFHGERRLERKLLLLHGFRRGKPEFKSQYWKAAKKQLKSESNGKCAYCEAPTDSVAHGDVEHYRPKSTYWWLAYCYDNYLYSCQICNQSYKGDNFPIGGTPLSIDPPLPDPFPEGMSEAELRELVRRFAPDPLDDAQGLPMAEFQRAADREKPHLPNPYAADPEPLFGWVADPHLKEVEITARSNRVASRRAFQAAVDYLGLNREELRRVRWKTYQPLARFCEVLLTPGLPAAAADIARAQIRVMMQPDAPFAGMVRYFVRHEWELDLGPGD